MKIFFKKHGACVLWAPVFFPSLLAGKFDRVKQLLTTTTNEIKKSKCLIKLRKNELRAHVSRSRLIES